MALTVKVAVAELPTCLGSLQEMILARKHHDQTRSRTALNLIVGWACATRYVDMDSSGAGVTLQPRTGWWELHSSGSTIKSHFDGMATGQSHGFEARSAFMSKYRHLNFAPL